MKDRLRILALGAHAGDMEVAAGGAIAKHTERGDEVTIIHLTLGERGILKYPPRIMESRKGGRL